MCVVLRVRWVPEIDCSLQRHAITQHVNTPDCIVSYIHDRQLAYNTVKGMSHRVLMSTVAHGTDLSLRARDAVGRDHTVLSALPVARMYSL